MNTPPTHLLAFVGPLATLTAMLALGLPIVAMTTTMLG